MKFTEHGYALLRKFLATNIGGMQIETQDGTQKLVTICPPTIQGNIIKITCSFLGKLKPVTDKLFITNISGCPILTVTGTPQSSVTGGTTLITLNIEVG